MASWLVQPNAGLGGGGGVTTTTSPDWVSVINDVAQSWWTLLNPPRTPAIPATDYGQVIAQQQAAAAAAAAQQQRTLLLIGGGLIAVYLLTRN